MDTFLSVIISNSLLAVAISIIAAVAAWARVKPALVHILWVLVLLKLFTPPIVAIGVPIGIGQSEHCTEPVVGTIIASNSHADALPDLRTPLVPWPWYLITIWLAGAASIAMWHSVRILRTSRLMRHASAAPDFLNEIADVQSARLGLARRPEILTLPVRITPAVWAIGGRPRIIFPIGLVTEMARERLETLVAHELAHVRRRDHLVRYLEMVATIVFWWHPAVWIAWRQLREMEERACDALVLTTTSHSASTYALALVETLEFLKMQSGSLPIVATAARPLCSLERRIEMMKFDFRRNTVFGAALAGAACCLLAVAVADDPPQGKMLIRDSQGQDGKIRVILRDQENQAGVPRLLALDNSADGEASGKVRIRVRGSDDGAPMMLLRGAVGDDDDQVRRIIRDSGSDDGAPRMLLRGAVGDDDDQVRRIIRDSGSDDGAPRMLIRGDTGDGENGIRRIIRNAENQDGIPRFLFRGSAGDGESNGRVLVRPPASEGEPN